MEDLLSYGSSVSIVQMDRQCEFVITIAVTFAIVIAKEYHLLPFAMLPSAEHSGLAPPTYSTKYLHQLNHVSAGWPGGSGGTPPLHSIEVNETCKNSTASTELAE